MPTASISSMKTILGLCSSATLNSSRTSLGPSPRYFWISSLPTWHTIHKWRSRLDSVKSQSCRYNQCLNWPLWGRLRWSGWRRPSPARSCQCQGGRTGSPGYSIEKPVSNCVSRRKLVSPPWAAWSPSPRSTRGGWGAAPPIPWSPANQW